MNCRDAVALVTGIVPGDLRDMTAARRHVEDCPVCADQLDRPGTAEQVLARLAQIRPAPGRPLRAVLLVVASLQIAVAMPLLFGVDPFGFAGAVSAEHLARDGALGLVVGVAGILVSHRPKIGTAMVGVCIAAALAQAAFTAIDTQDGQVHASFETVHLLMVGTVLLIVLTAVRRVREEAGLANRGPSKAAG